MGFELRDHTADVAVAATGGSLEGVFAAVADGLAAAGCDSIPPAGGERFSVSVAADGREALLFDYLDELIYQRDVRAVLPVDNRVDRIERAAADPIGTEDEPTDGETDSADAETEPTDVEGSDGGDASLSLVASARGVPLDAVDAREVKAVTYSEMRLEEVDGGWEAYVVFDV